MNDLDWLAYCYLKGELGAAELAAFEARLAEEQPAREALARAVEIDQAVVASGDRRADESRLDDGGRAAHDGDTAAHELASPSPQRVGLRRMRFAAIWGSLAAAACVAVAIGVQFFRSGVELARVDAQQKNELSSNVEAIVWSEAQGEPSPLAWDESLASAPVDGGAHSETNAADDLAAEPTDVLAQREAELLEDAPSWLITGVTGEAFVDDSMIDDPMIDNPDADHVESVSNPTIPDEVPSAETRE